MGFSSTKIDNQLSQGLLNILKAHLSSVCFELFLSKWYYFKSNYKSF